MDADWIYGKKEQDPTEIRELKVKIPVTYHDRLHKLKVLRGKTMSKAVAEALDAYFATFETGHAVAVAVAQD